MNPLRTAFWIAKGVGWENVPRRIYQAAMIRSGLLHRKLAPQRFSIQRFHNTDNDVQKQITKWNGRKARFFRIPKRDELRATVSPDQWNELSSRVCCRARAGHYQYFSHWEGEIGWPPNFNRDPVNHIDWPIGKHFLETARSGPPRNDIKLVWEPSRFTLAYYFAREYIYSSDPQWAEAYWQMFDAWIQQNPVNHSVAWGCGQEVAFRLMAMLTATFSTLDSRFATPERLEKLEFLCWQSATRIAANINYALSQENNHSLSEAVGLWTVALVFPEFDESRKWLSMAKKIFVREVGRQVYDDGSYVQHSMSYHRVMLDDMSWAIGLGNINEVEIPQATIERVSKAVEWLFEFVNEETGRVPNYGTNDGANVLPLSCSDYLDFRPTLQAAATLCGNSKCNISVGHWSEKTLWLTGRLPSEGEARPKAPIWQAPIGGYHIVRGPQSQIMVRATRYKDRPSQCDMLHVDLTFRGHNVLRDAGSFYYYHDDKSIKNYFYSVEAHNTVQVNGHDQMIKGPGFLWFCWPHGSTKIIGQQQLLCSAKFVGKGRYEHQRKITGDGDVYEIEDVVNGADVFDIRWRLTPNVNWLQTGPLRFTAEIENQSFAVSLHTTEDVEATLEDAWESLYYGERQKIPCVLIRNLRRRLMTSVGPIR